MIIWEGVGRIGHGEGCLLPAFKVGLGELGENYAAL